MENSEKFVGYLTEAGYYSLKQTKDKDSDGARTVPYSPSYVGTPLHCAVLLGDKQQVQQVMKENGSLTAGFGRCGKSTVSLAVISRDEDLLELLLRNGCSAVAPDADARTPLHHAAQKAADGCMRLLLGWCEAPGTPTAMAALTPDQHGVTPLHVATSTSSTKCLVLLLKHSEAGMVDPQDNKKRTPLHWAARYNNEPAVALLLRHGANCHMPDDQGQTPLHCALLPSLPQSVAAVRSNVG
ncbi:Ankyrin repeat-containing domain [Trinorchestia longiramus]|nr:Ankyrin repeat-containing domain [Trinorchestia longiramus]